MKHCYLRDIYENKDNYLNKTVTVCGWIKNKRIMKNVCFVELSDGTVMSGLQLVSDRKQPCHEAVKKIETGTTVCVEGTLKMHPTNNALELHVFSLEFFGLSASDYPIQNNKIGLEYLRGIPHLRTRLSYFEAVFRIRSVLITSIHDFFVRNHFMNISTPIITSNDFEGAGKLFGLITSEEDDIDNIEKDSHTDYSNYFGKKVYLTVSGQLELEAMVSSFSKVYGLGPVFRADDSNTKRHVAEFWMLETEIAFADLKDAMETAEDMIKYVINCVVKECKEELLYLSERQGLDLTERLNGLLENKFRQLDYSDAIIILKNAETDFEHPVEFGADLKTEHIKWLSEYYWEQPLYIFNHPKELQPFYVRSNPDSKTVASSILYFPEIGDVVGVSQKEDRYEMLENRIDELKMNKESYQWYLNLRRYGSVPHSGFGLGVERILMFLTGNQNIRDVIAFPRAKCKKWIL